ncbi:hypothetical protein N7495_002784 [Penicillium taxi]|uniref:uncharacterized protein n=1 Tax=Penicillium taxi TaxID=168475 RepID=UPI00254575FD|nr:uncharacterized protein N7495_002784 [Penicillium taxi]KAJ5902256.1 hypothetical protein N7495_002784 [Penicillium taxi]
MVKRRDEVHNGFGCSLRSGSELNRGPGLGANSRKQPHGCGYGDADAGFLEIDGATAPRLRGR